MDNKKFNSFFAYFVGILMVISFIYILFLLKPKKVSNYKVAKDIRYSGEIVKNKLNGKGELTTPEGKYIGEFKDSRFDGLGKFAGDNFIYFSKFNKNKANKNTPAVKNLAGINESPKPTTESTPPDLDARAEKAPANK